MWSLGDWRHLFMAVGLIGIIMFCIPSITVFVQLPGGESFSELYILSQEHMINGLPHSVSPGQDCLIYLDVGNHMGQAEYYRAFVKFRNESEPLPNATEGVPSSLPVLYTYNIFLDDGQIWESTLTFSFSNVTFGQTMSSIGRMTVNGVSTDVEKRAVYDATLGHSFQIFVELWIYDVTIHDFVYHNRFVTLWLNMTALT